MLCTHWTPGGGVTLYTSGEYMVGPDSDGQGLGPSQLGDEIEPGDPRHPGKLGIGREPEALPDGHSRYWAGGRWTEAQLRAYADARQRLWALPGMYPKLHDECSLVLRIGQAAARDLQWPGRGLDELHERVAAALGQLGLPLDGLAAA